MSGRHSEYPSYAESGIEWVGAAPSEWTVQPFFVHAKQCKRSNRGMINDNLLSLSYGKIVRKSIDTSEGLLPESFETYQIVELDDVVFRLTDLQNDKRSLRSALCGENGIITSAYLAAQPVRINPKYFAYLMRSYDLTKVLYALGSGLRQSLKYSDMKRLPVLVPSKKEQTQIAKFLDYETARIDALIEKQQQLIALLKEKRQAVISHAVTKGLNPDAPMRDSGVEWLGEVPAHWDIVAIKHLVLRPIIDGPHETPKKCDEGIPFVSAEAISQGFINFDKIWGHISPEDHDRYSRRYSPQRGDLLLVKLGATTGTPAIVETDAEFNIWVPLAAISLRPEIVPRLVFYILQSDSLKDAYQLNWTYGTQQTLGLRTISNLRLALPPKKERLEIVQKLDDVLPQLESLTSKAEDATKLLQERRTALISAAVTGKIDVRDWKQPKPEAEAA